MGNGGRIRVFYYLEGVVIVYLIFEVFDGFF